MSRPFAVLLAAAGAVPTLGGVEARKRQRPSAPEIVAHADAVRALPAGTRKSLDGWYIVTLRDDAGDPGAFADARAASDGVLVSHVYRHAIRGFAARLDAQALNALERDPRVLAVVPDAAVAPPPRSEPATQSRQVFPPVGQTTPDGVKRIQAPENPLFHSGSIDVDVAVYGTGVDGIHPDLGVAGGVSCIGGDPLVDPWGIDTHVAGIIGALDNDFGVVGVAPGARLWSVQVWDETGSGTVAMELCGIDWITANSGVVEVAFLDSYYKTRDDGNCGYSVKDAVHQAICSSVEAGVTYVVGASASCKEVETHGPAGFAEVITVGMMVDTDGQPGSYGNPSFASGCAKNWKSVHRNILNPDDALASSANVSDTIDLWAPGVEVLSTYPADLAWSNRPYVTLSGPIYAAAHVAGAAALVKAQHPDYTPAQVRQALVDSAERVYLWNPYTGYKWNNDRPSIENAPVVNVNPAGPWPASE